MAKFPRSEPENTGTDGAKRSRQASDRGATDVPTAASPATPVDRATTLRSQRASQTPKKPAIRRPTTTIRDSELPVVARLVVEIRSDGTRTIARGAIEDMQSGESVALETRASSPFELSLNLAKMLLQAPALASNSLRGTLPSPATLRSHARARLTRLGRRLRRRIRGHNNNNNNNM